MAIKYNKVNDYELEAEIRTQDIDIVALPIHGSVHRASISQGYVSDGYATANYLANGNPIEVQLIVISGNYNEGTVKLKVTSKSGGPEVERIKRTIDDAVAEKPRRVDAHLLRVDPIQQLDLNARL